MPPPAPLSKATGLAQLLLARRDGSVLFHSFGGQYSDNPRAVHEELAARDTSLRSVWATQAQDVPAGTATVPPRSAAYSQAAGRARAVVSNEALPLYVKKPGTVYLQTWHGSMLKRIGYDNPRYATDPEGLRRARRDYARWDLLVSQSPFCTRTMRRAFRYDGEVLEVGYPRNDLLLSPGAAAVRRRVREAYGVADDVLLLLYAPTFRDGQVTRPARLPLDVEALARAAGRPVHVLVRLHHRVRAALTEPPGPAWSSASEHPDVRQLYLASDVLVTDYSSSMFDYAVTGKPMVFFAYDLDAYRDELRGFYFDLVEQAPGPVCTTTAQVAAAVADLPGTVAAHAAAYASFAETYCPWDDGRASVRVVDRLLSALS